MPQPIVVFLGPTLDHDTAASRLDAIYRAPAEQGSIVRAVCELDPRSIVLIDGAFASVPAVRHKEILWALSEGIPVIGAASIGALRAAELTAFGMGGHGLIYRWYRATPFADDDEVAVAMTPPELGARPLSDALINIRLTLRLAERRGLVRRADRLRLCGLARSLHFVERRYATLFAGARAAGLGSPSALDALADWVAHNAVDQKHADALSLLSTLAAMRDSPHEAVRSGRALAKHPFQLTEAWLIDLEEAGIHLPIVCGGSN